MRLRKPTIQPNKNARFQQLDWRNPDPSVAADLLLASDVAYEKRAFEPLLKTFQELLKPDGTILLTEPNREMFKPFISSLDTEGYAFKQTQRNITLKNHTFLINIYEIKRLSILNFFYGEIGYLRYFSIC